MLPSNVVHKVAEVFATTCTPDKNLKQIPLFMLIQCVCADYKIGYTINNHLFGLIIDKSHVRHLKKSLASVKLELYDWREANQTIKCYQQSYTRFVKFMPGFIVFFRRRADVTAAPEATIQKIKFTSYRNRHASLLPSTPSAWSNQFVVSRRCLTSSSHQHCKHRASSLLPISREQ